MTTYRFLLSPVGLGPCLVRLGVAALACTGLQACGPGPHDPGDVEAEGELVLSTGEADLLVVDATALTFEITDDGLESVELTRPTRTSAQRVGGSFYVWNVPFPPGDTLVRLEGIRLSGSTAERELLVRNSGAPRQAFTLTSEPEVPEPGAPLRLILMAREDLVVSSYLIDLDGDGRLEASGPIGNGIVELQQVPTGVLQPRIALRDQRGLIYANGPGEVAWQPPLPPPQPIDWGVPAGLTQAIDADSWHGGSLAWTLCASSRSAYQFDARGQHVRTVAPDGVGDVSGFGVDTNGDLYFVDRTSARVVRHIRESDYAPDASFAGKGDLGVRGTGSTELLDPSDVALARDPASRATWICVADTGNDRLQLYDFDGRHLRAIRGPAEDPLIAPTRVVTVAGSAFAVLSGGRVRMFAAGGDELVVLEALSSQRSIAPAVTSLALDRQRMELWTHDDANARLEVHGLNGALLRTIPFAGPVSAIALLDSGDRRVLLLGADSTLDSLDAYWLPQDPDGEAPNQVARRFLALLTTGDLRATFPLADPQLLGILLFMQEERPDEWAALLAAAASVQSATTVFQGASSAVVLCELPSPGPTSAPRLSLVRGESDGRWRVNGL